MITDDGTRSVESQPYDLLFNLKKYIKGYDLIPYHFFDFSKVVLSFSRYKKLFY